MGKKTTPKKYLIPIPNLPRPPKQKKTKTVYEKKREVETKLTPPLSPTDFYSEKGLCFKPLGSFFNLPASLCKPSLVACQLKTLYGGCGQTTRVKASSAGETGISADENSQGISERQVGSW